jgi:hypothetical protein
MGPLSQVEAVKALHLCHKLDAAEGCAQKTNEVIESPPVQRESPPKTRNKTSRAAIIVCETYNNGYHFLTISKCVPAKDRS